jgi:hypothetical protein
MKPFTNILYAAHSGYRCESVLVEVKGDLWETIRLWSMFLILMHLDPVKYQRSIHSFAEPAAYSVFINLDGSLTGLGLLIWARPEPAEAVQWPIDLTCFCPPPVDLLAMVGYTVDYQLGGDSSYQNSMEFITIVVSLAILVSLGLRDITVVVQGDSTSALAWASKQKFKTSRCRVAALIYMRISMRCGVLVSAVTHQAGILQVYSDPLSRDESPESVCAKGGFSRDAIRHLENNVSLLRLVQMMDPSKEFDMGLDLQTCWAEIDAIVDVLTSLYGGWAVGRV